MRPSKRSQSASSRANGVAVVPLSVGTDATYAVQIGSGCSGATSGTDGGDGLPPDGGAASNDAGADATVGPGDGGAGGDASGSDAGDTGPGGASSPAGCGCVLAGEGDDRGVAAWLGCAGLALAAVRRRRAVRSS